MSRSLVILAAGLGRRFGGAKQLAPLGPGGEALLEYTVVDALRAGFDSLVLITRAELRDEFDAFARDRLRPLLPVTIVLQDMATLPPGRTTPGGTGHALLAAEAVIDHPFGVANADDFYGRAAFLSLGRFLAGEPANFAVVAYPLERTLSTSGGVNRGVIERNATGTLTRIEEVVDIEQSDGVIVGRVPAGPTVLHGRTPVSMNLWAFTPGVFGFLREGFDRFHQRRDRGRDEFPLPTAVQEIIERGVAAVEVLPGGENWFGVTHEHDTVSVRAELRRLVDAGVYSSPL